METFANVLALATSLAARHSTEIPPAELARVIKEAATPVELSRVIRELQRQTGDRMDRSPGAARQFARVAHGLARATAEAALEAESALTLAMAFNRLGEFAAAVPLADRAAAFLTPHGAKDRAARALCELALAQKFIGERDQAIQAIARARALTKAPLAQAHCDWVQARVYRDQARYPEAIALLGTACQRFQDAQLPLQAARCERELAHTYVLGECGEPVPLLVRSKETFETAGCSLDAALCDYFMAGHLQGRSRYAEALEVLLPARRRCSDEGAGYFTAWCDEGVGIAYRHLNRFDDALRALTQAREYFLAHRIRSEVSACDINLGNTYYALNRYDEALALYQEAAELALTEGREARAARLYTNMGLVYAKQGLYTKSLYLHERALQIADAKGLSTLAAGNHEDLAACYRQLGDYAAALAHLEEHARLTPGASGERFVAMRIDLAHVLHALGDVAQAVTCLEQVRHTAAVEGLDSYVAICDRLLAEVTASTAGREQSLTRVENARELFRKHAQTVDAALCDLTEGELRLQWNERTAARDCFRRARAVLAPAFPDQAWRADYGLARCAATAGEWSAALEHYLCAVHTVASSRSALVTEQLSNDYFAGRQSLFDDALALALQLDQAESALDVIEASKARTFLTLVQNREWRAPLDGRDAYIADLIARERSLRYQLDALRGRLAVPPATELVEALRGGDASAPPASAALDELNTLSRAYEAVVSQLRRAARGLAGVSIPAPFALAQFRAEANKAFGADWTALDYDYQDGALTVVVVGPDSLRVERKTLSAYDRAVLEECTTRDAESRELVYRGTLSGVPVPATGREYLRHLYHLLMPEGRRTTLIVAPSGPLHALPFQALITDDGDAFLIERHAILYAPNLQALQLLLREPSDRPPRHALVLGVSDFGARARPLPYAGREVDLVQQAFDRRGTLLWEEQATRRKLLELDASDELRTFDVLHFATHALLDRQAPHQSRILLSDEALTITDILDLALDARLVTLSACQTALGDGGRGDELVSLARTFLYAGADALLGTLWHVEDRSMAELAGQFYRHFTAGENAAAALRQAQVEMIRAGHPPYQWAPLVLIGRP